MHACMDETKIIEAIRALGREAAATPIRPIGDYGGLSRLTRPYWEDLPSLAQG